MNFLWLRLVWALTSCKRYSIFLPIVAYISLSFCYFLFKILLFNFMNYWIDMYCNNCFRFQNLLFKKNSFSLRSALNCWRACAYLYSRPCTLETVKTYTTSHKTFPVWGRKRKRKRRRLRLVLFRTVYNTAQYQRSLQCKAAVATREKKK